MFGGAFFGPTYFGPSYWGTGDFVPPPPAVDLPGGGESKRRLPPDHYEEKLRIHRELAMREDEEIIAVLEIYLNSRK